MPRVPLTSFQTHKSCRRLPFLRDEVALLLLPDQDEASAVRFDALLYGIELAYLVGKKYTRARKDLRKKVTAVASVSTIPEVRAQSELMEKILHTDYLDNAGINEFEHIRKSLRDLMKYLPHDGKIYAPISRTISSPLNGEKPIWKTMI